MTTFLADGTDWALFDGADDLPFSDPYTHISRVRAHSAFDYIRFPSSSPTISTSRTPSNPGPLTQTINLGAHGRSGVPFIFGRVNVFGSWCPLIGSVIVHIAPVSRNFIAWNLAVDATNVYIIETRSNELPFTAATTSLPIEVWVSENIVDGTDAVPNEVYMSPGVFYANRLDSRKRFLRKTASGTLGLSGGRTWTGSTISSPPSGGGQPWQAFRYNIGSLTPARDVVSQTWDGVTAFDNNPPAVNPRIATVAIGGPTDAAATDTFEINPGAGYARVVDTDKTVVLDTRDEIFHIVSKLNGSVSFGSLVWGSGPSPRARRQTVTLGSVSPVCDYVLGLVRVDYSTGNSALPAGVWYVAGGSIVNWVKSFQQSDGTNGPFISSIGILSITTAGGTVTAEENIMLKDNRYNFFGISSAAYTVTYRLFCGTFT